MAPEANMFGVRYDSVRLGGRLRIRLGVAVAACKLVTWLSRRLGAGAGSNFPGRVALRIEPQATRLLADRLEHGCIVVSGTNGKTTTANMLAAILRQAGYQPVHNRAGANLISGITATLAQSHGDIGLFEVDEATLPGALERLHPRLIVITNLFRDQLDRYGELESLGRKMSAGIARMAPDTWLLLNADDPLVAMLGEGSGLEHISFYGIEYEGYGTMTLEHASDSTHCRTCGALLDYSVVYFGHMGKYKCVNCGATRPVPDFAATHLDIHGMDHTEVSMRSPGGPLTLDVKVPGLYNVHNALAASGGALLLGMEEESVRAGLAGYATAFGRAERIPAEGREIFLVLSKNPAGFNEVIRTISSDGGENLHLLMALNDLIADGRDVSWIWDVDFEDLAVRADRLVATGLRAPDMALRMKYAGVPAQNIELEPDLERALAKGIEMTPPGETLFALTTYTATLALRRVMQRKGYVSHFWKEGADA